MHPTKFKKTCNVKSCKRFWMRPGSHMICPKWLNWRVIRLNKWKTMYIELSNGLNRTRKLIFINNKIATSLVKKEALYSDSVAF